jgi:hypothetical protein
MKQNEKRTQKLMNGNDQKENSRKHDVSTKLETK